MSEYATVHVNLLNLRQYPGTTYTILERLPYGTRLEVLSDSQAEWVQVRTKHQTGYVAGAFITIEEAITFEQPRIENPLLAAYVDTIPDYELSGGYQTIWRHQKPLGLPDPFEVLPVDLKNEREIERLWLNGFGANYFSFMYWTGWYRGTGGMHSGFDFMVKQNTPLLAVSDGVIVHGWRFLRNAYDKTQVLWCFLPEEYRDSQGRRMMSNVMVAYAHMNNNAVKKHLEVVKSGEVIGYSGTPGGSGTNAHLHLEVHLLEGDPSMPYARQPETRLLKEYHRRQLQNNNTPWNPIFFFTPRLMHYLQHQDKIMGYAGKAKGYPTDKMLSRAGITNFSALNLFTLAYYRYGMPIIWNNIPPVPEKGVQVSETLPARLKAFPAFEPYEAWFL